MVVDSTTMAESILDTVAVVSIAVVADSTQLVVEVNNERKLVVVELVVVVVVTLVEAVVADGKPHLAYQQFR